MAIFVLRLSWFWAFIYQLTISYCMNSNSFLRIKHVIIYAHNEVHILICYCRLLRGKVDVGLIHMADQLWNNDCWVVDRKSIANTHDILVYAEGILSKKLVKFLVVWLEKLRGKIKIKVKWKTETALSFPLTLIKIRTSKIKTVGWRNRTQSQLNIDKDL